MLGGKKLEHFGNARSLKPLTHVATAQQDMLLIQHLDVCGESNVKCEIATLVRRDKPNFNTTYRAKEVVRAELLGQSIPYRDCGEVEERSCGKVRGRSCGEVRGCFEGYSYQIRRCHRNHKRSHHHRRHDKNSLPTKSLHPTKVLHKTFHPNAAIPNNTV